jgi:hypothetical protein
VSYKFTSSCIITSTESNPKRLIENIYIKLGTNKLFFVLIRPSAKKLVNIFPIIFIFLGDFLGIFSSKIRFLEYYNIAQVFEGLILNL